MHYHTHYHYDHHHHNATGGPPGPQGPPGPARPSPPPLPAPPPQPFPPPPDVTAAEYELNTTITVDPGVCSMIPSEQHITVSGLGEGVKAGQSRLGY